MRLILVTVLFLSIVFCDENVENKFEDEKTKDEENISSTKTKRGIHGCAHGLSYPLSLYGLSFARYSPYAKFPGIYKTSPVASFALTPGNAVVHSFNVNYPKVIVPKPVIRPAIPPPILFHSKPVLPLHSVPVSVYANRYPVIVHKPLFQKPTVPQFSPPAFIPSSTNILPQSTIISQDGWRPIFSSVPSVQSSPINPPAVTVLPPHPSQLSNTPSFTQSKNYYLPPDPSEQYQHQQLQHDLQAHLQQLQAIQHHQNFIRSEQNEGIITPLSEQGYEIASNNGRYTGPTSYDPNPSGPLYEIHSRGQVN